MGEQKDRTWYNQMYSSNYDTIKMYNLPPTKTAYYPMWEWMISYMNHDEPIIELGCGTGQLAQLLKNYNYVMGYDFSEVAIRQAVARNFSSKFRVADIFDLPGIPDDATIICTEVIEHINDDVILLNKYKNHKILFSVPGFDGPSHVRHFDSLEDVLSRYDFLNVTDVRKFKFTPDPRSLFVFGVVVNGKN